MAFPESKTSREDGRLLGEAINVATREVHTKLNRLIVSRLPLAIPPRASNPSTYVTGLLHVAPIYIAFESLWQNLLQHHESNIGNETCSEENEGCQPGNPLMDSDSLVLYPFHEGGSLAHKPLVCDRVHSVLTHLHLPGLLRSAALRSDIRDITGWPEHVVEEQIHAATASGHLQELLGKTKAAIEQNPHVLLAYAWVFYMALFSGGKFIKGSLEAAGRDFWAETSDPVRPSMLACDADPSLIHFHDDPQNSADVAASTACLPLAFFRFDTPSGGEDLKIEFKKRLAESETLLTPHERDQVVQEATQIFERTILLVSQLDGLFGTSPAATNTEDGWTSFLMSRVGRRPRDSVVVAKERSLRGIKLAEDNGKRSRSSTTSSVNSVNVQGTLSPLAELVTGQGGQEPQSKTVRFEKKLTMPVTKGDRHGKKTHFGNLDGTADEKDMSRECFGTVPYRFQVGWHHAILAGLAVALVRVYYFGG